VTNTKNPVLQVVPGILRLNSNAPIEAMEQHERISALLLLERPHAAAQYRALGEAGLKRGIRSENHHRWAKVEKIIKDEGEKFASPGRAPSRFAWPDGWRPRRGCVPPPGEGRTGSRSRRGVPQQRRWPWCRRRWKPRPGRGPSTTRLVATPAPGRRTR
jgi:hypothetical protein